MEQYDDDSLCGCDAPLLAKGVSQQCYCDSCSCQKQETSVENQEEEVFVVPLTLTEKGSQYEVANYAVSGMTCASCVATIENFVGDLDGVEDIKVNLLSERATVKFSPTFVSAMDLREAFEDIGFEAKLLLEDVFGEVRVSVSGMTCASCASSIENALMKLKAVTNAQVNFLTAIALIRYDPTKCRVRDILRLIEELGYGATLAVDDSAENLSDALQRKREIAKYRRLFIIALFFAVPAFVIGFVLPFIPEIKEQLTIKIWRGLTPMAIVMFVLATPVQFWLGLGFHVRAVKALRHCSATMDVLVSLGTNAAYLYSIVAIIISLVNPLFESDLYFETSVLLITFILLGRYLENVAKGKTSEAITKLMSLQAPTTVLVTLDDVTEKVLKEEDLDTSLVEVGDILKVVPGDRIPTDGIIFRGHTAIDESMLTGESMPVDKAEGENVVGGTVNQSGMILMQTTRVGKETTLARIVKLIEDAQLQKAPIQRFADKVSSIFVPCVLIASALTFVLWMSFTSTGVVPVMSFVNASNLTGLQNSTIGEAPSESWIPPGSSPFLVSFLFAIAVLVIACPCALGLATPTAVMVGTGVGATHGVLIKGGAVLQKSKDVNVILFDKTGTLTYGRPVVTETILFDKVTGLQEFYSLIGAAESGSEHPLARAVVAEANKMGVQNLEEPVDFQAKSGHGLTCKVGGDELCIGNRRMMAAHGMQVTFEMEDQAEKLEAKGKTVIFCARPEKGGILGLVAISDTARKEARHVIRYLSDHGKEVWMITGDNARTALAIAQDLGIPSDHVLADVLPADKTEKVASLQKIGARPEHKKNSLETKCVAFVGDGINDAPALTQADVGIAIGAGTEIAIEAADMVLMKSDLRDVVTALDLGHKTYNRIRINFIWAFLYNTIGIPIAAGVLYPVIRPATLPPAAAGLAMALSSVSVVLSSLALKLYKKPDVALADDDHEPSIFEEFFGVEHTSQSIELIKQNITI
jgi:Cu+-exporting ATPase